MNRSVCFVAAPLIARSGVYRSTIELVQAARAAGLDWTAVIGVSSGAGGRTVNVDGVREIEVEPAGVGGVVQLARMLRGFPDFARADLVVTMVPQADMALALTRRPWVAYLRGLPWPAPGEASGLRSRIWRLMEMTALRRAREVWATTPQLAGGAGAIVDRLVPPGITQPSPVSRTGLGDEVVWAARYSKDKNPTLFFDALRDTQLRGLMYGSGPLEHELRASAPENISVPGWATAETIWRDASVYVGTSSREAFGRSAVEAAMRGIPVVISDQFGCAPSLYTSAQLSERFVLPIDQPHRWRAAVEELASDDGLHAEVAAHVQKNALLLTVECAVVNVGDAIAKLDLP